MSRDRSIPPTVEPVHLPREDGSREPDGNSLNHSASSRHDDLLSIVIRGMQEPVILLDRNCRVLEINASALEWLGLPPDTKDLVLTADVDTGPVTDEAGRTLTWEDAPHVCALNGQTVVDRLQIHERGDGRRYYIFSAYPIRNAAGEVDMALIAGRDVTRLKQAEAALRESEEQLACLVESMDDIIYTLDTQQRYVKVFSGWIHKYELDPSFFVGKTTREVFGDAADVHEAANARALNGETASYEWWVDHQGSRLHFQTRVSPMRDALGKITGVVGIGRDITELRRLQARTERMLRTIARQDRALQAVIDCMPAGLLVVDSEFRLLNWNLAFVRAFGPSADWRTGKRLWDVIPHVEETGVLGSLRRVMATGEPVSVSEYRHETPGGEASYWDASVVPLEIETDRGTVQAVAVVCVDVSEGVRARERLSELAAAAKQHAVELELERSRLMRAQEQVQAFYEREHRISEKLQYSFMFDGCPLVPGYEIGHRYKPGLDDALVGGDFLDVFHLDQDRLALVISDVAGKGMRAAVYTAMTKYMLRAYALEDSRPETVLARLNEALGTCTPPDVFITLVYCILDMHSGTLTYANAGHEPPIHYSAADGLAVSLDVTGRGLAMLGGSAYSALTVPLAPGDLIVLYTDGITDAGSGPDRLGCERLLRMVESSARRPSQEIADGILEATLEYAGGSICDDAALLVVKAHGL